MSLRPWTDCQEEEEIDYYPERVRRSSPVNIWKDPNKSESRSKKHLPKKHLPNERLPKKHLQKKHQPKSKTNKDEFKIFKSYLDKNGTKTIHKSPSSRLLKTVRRLKKRLAKLEAVCKTDLEDYAKEKDQKDGMQVCVDYLGKVRMEGESWLHQKEVEDCVYCQCKKHQITCSLQMCQ